MLNDNDLEDVSHCPVCKSADHSMLLSELLDLTYFTSDRRWSLSKCNSCESIFINPRAKAESIYLLYDGYYTQRSINTADRAGLRALIDAIEASYLRFKFGNTQRIKDYLIGGFLYLWQSRRLHLEYDMRHLPKCVSKNSLLDVGCGNGRFIKNAKSLGWNVIGIDVDRKALQLASEQDLEVYGATIEQYSKSTNKRFDVITLNNVIEHLPNPNEAIKACYDLLKPGGVLWLDTPNINSSGFAFYGMDWRGLEIPRHLVLFTHASLSALLTHTGFICIKDLPYRKVCNVLFQSSAEILSHRTGSNKDLQQRKAKKLAMEAEVMAKKAPAVREFINIVAYKPL